MKGAMPTRSKRRNLLRQCRRYRRPPTRASLREKPRNSKPNAQTANGPAHIDAQPHLLQRARATMSRKRCHSRAPRRSLASRRKCLREACEPTPQNVPSGRLPAKRNSASGKGAARINNAPAFARIPSVVDLCWGASRICSPYLPEVAQLPPSQRNAAVRGHSCAPPSAPRCLWERIGKRRRRPGNACRWPVPLDATLGVAWFAHGAVIDVARHANPPRLARPSQKRSGLGVGRAFGRERLENGEARGRHRTGRAA